MKCKEHRHGVMQLGNDCCTINVSESIKAWYGENECEYGGLLSVRREPDG